MARPSFTRALPRIRATEHHRWTDRLKTLLAGPRRTIVGLVLLAASLVVAGVAILLPTQPSVPTASTSHLAASHAPASTTPAASPASTAAPASPAAGPAAVDTPETAAPVALPDTGTHALRVRRRLTLWALARRYGTTVATLQALNRLGSSTVIYAGQQLLVPAGHDQTTLTRPAVSTTPVASAATALPSSTATASTSGFGGIFAFSGGNTAELASDPDVAGRSLVYYWAQLNPQPGVYRWDLIDKDIAPWVAAGKKVILRVAAAGWASWDTQADSAHGTPAWVYAQGVKSVTEKDGAVLPQYWSPVFLRDLCQFVRAFAARYDGNPHVALVDLPVGIGGETKPDSEKNPNLLTLWRSIGYTDPIWWTAVQKIITVYTQAFHSTPLAVMPDKTFLGTTPGYNEAKTLTYAVSKGLWLQDNGLVPGRTLPAPWGQTPVVSEQRNPTSADRSSLAAEFQAALADKARLILVFTGDLDNPANRAVIHRYAARGGTACGHRPVTTGASTTAMCPLARAVTTTAPAIRHGHSQSGTDPARTVPAMDLNSRKAS